MRGTTTLKPPRSSLESRLSAVESRLTDVETVRADVDKLKQSVAEHDEWMGKLELKFDSVKSSVDKVRAEVRSTSWNRLLVVVALAFVFFIIWGVLAT